MYHHQENQQKQNFLLSTKNYLFFISFRNSFFSQSRVSLCFALAHVKKYARESLFLDISERESTLLKEQRIRRVFLYHCLSFCEYRVLPSTRSTHIILFLFVSRVVQERHHSIWAACSVICDFQSHREQRRESFISYLEDRNKRNYSQNDEGKNLSRRSFSNDDDTK